jgi:hypothetical protein
MLIYVKIIKKIFNYYSFYDNFMLIYVKIITKKIKNVFNQTDRQAYSQTHKKFKNTYFFYLILKIQLLKIQMNLSLFSKNSILDYII